MSAPLSMPLQPNKRVAWTFAPAHHVNMSQLPPYFKYRPHQRPTVPYRATDYRSNEYFQKNLGLPHIAQKR